MLQDYYLSDVRSKLCEEFKYKNPMMIPKLVKVVVNVGLGNEDSKFFDEVEASLALITGQNPLLTVARKSIAGFKIRVGNKLGYKVTLRSKYMFYFIEKLLFFALPRARDFNGISSKQFDGRGNLNIGIKDHSVFQEVNYDRMTKAYGMNVTIVTTAKTDNEAIRLLSLLDFPLI